MAVDVPEVELVPLSELRPDPANPRRIPEQELEALTRSLREFGFLQPVVARREDRLVIGGHQRLVAARKLGFTEVPVIFVDLSLERGRLLGLALNRISGEWDEEMLARTIAELTETENLDLSLSGFGDEELARLLRQLDRRDRRERIESFDVDAALGQRTTRCRNGDLWQLGQHRLLIGDATVGADVERLLDGVRATMAFTDPPYNVDLGNHGGQGRGQRRRQIANDNLAPEEWREFVRGWAKNLLASVDGAVYVCMSSKEWPVLADVLEESGGHWSDTIIWAKDRFVLGRSDYQRAYEPIWYGWREGTKHHWNGGRDQGDVWTIARPSDSEAHPTMKPLPLVERAIENSSAADDIVLDLFLGSGSTAIASERTGRRCYGMELDPRYGDVIIARWESFSGAVANRMEGPDEAAL